jgi:hypothetical protein
VIERVLPWNELQRVCRGVIESEKFTTATGYGAWGCSVVKDGKCYVARIDVPGVRRHELAHCNGWPRDHPGGWYAISAEVMASQQGRLLIARRAVAW